MTLDERLDQIVYDAHLHPYDRAVREVAHQAALATLTAVADHAEAMRADTLLEAVATLREALKAKG